MLKGQEIGTNDKLTFDQKTLLQDISHRKIHNHLYVHTQDFTITHRIKEYASCALNQQRQTRINIVNCNTIQQQRLHNLTFLFCWRDLLRLLPCTQLD